MYKIPHTPSSAIKSQLASAFRLVATTSFLVAAFSFALPAAAKDETGAVNKTAVTVELTQNKVIKSADGKEHLVDAATAKPGDVLEYRATYVNHSINAVTGLIAELPIPQGLEYEHKSAKPATQVQIATADGIFGAEPLMRKVGSMQQEVPYSEYRKLNWTLGRLPAGGKASVSARAQVQTFVAPPTGELNPAPQTTPVSIVRLPTNTVSATR